MIRLSLSAYFSAILPIFMKTVAICLHISGILANFVHPLSHAPPGGLITTRTKTELMEYMSQEGDDKLVAEIGELELVKLPRVRGARAEARDKGDLSENFEYHAAKREQGRLLSRIRFKQKVLENARVIDKSLLKNDGIGLLSQVQITNLANGQRMTYTIVSSHEANINEGKISIKSPIAKVLLGHNAGETVEVRVPAGTLRLRIESVVF